MGSWLLEYATTAPRSRLTRHGRASPTAGPKAGPTLLPPWRPDLTVTPVMSPDPDTLAKQRAQLAKRRAERSTLSEEISEETTADSPESRHTSAQATAAMAASDPTHPSTLFASFSERDAGERRASEAAQAASASALAVHNARAARNDTLSLAVVESTAVDNSAQTDPPRPAPIPDHHPLTVDLFAAVILTLLAVGIVAVACVFPYQGLRDVAGDNRRWEVTLARWSVANDLPPWKGSTQPRRNESAGAVVSRRTCPPTPSRQG